MEENYSSIDSVMQSAASVGEKNRKQKFPFRTAAELYIKFEPEMISVLDGCILQADVLNGI